VIAGKFTFHPKYWTTISSEVKDLIEHLIVVNPQQRFTIDQVLNHSWLRPAVLEDMAIGQVSRDGPDRKSQAHEET
jgi:serine/threonine-protein kinase Chk2